MITKPTNQDILIYKATHDCGLLEAKRGVALEYRQNLLRDMTFVSREWTSDFKRFADCTIEFLRSLEDKQ